jgi:uncharacterized protein (DUF2345 family)
MQAGAELMPVTGKRLQVAAGMVVLLQDANGISLLCQDDPAYQAPEAAANYD